jgi:hypothetical protein
VYSLRIESSGLGVISCDIVPDGDSKARLISPLLSLKLNDTSTGTCSKLDMEQASPFTFIELETADSEESES